MLSGRATFFIHRVRFSGESTLKRGFSDSSVRKRTCLQCRRPWFDSWIRKVCCSRDRLPTPVFLGFPCGSAGKESACNAGDPGSIPGSRRSPGEGIGYPFQCSWASLVVQLVKNVPSMQETRIRPLGWEDPLEKGMAPHSSILAWRIPWTEEPGGLQSMELQRVGDD